MLSFLYVPTPNRPWCVMFPSLFPCVFIVQLLFNSQLWVRTYGAWLSVLGSGCWEWWFPDSSKSLLGHELIVFYGCVVFHGVYVPHFLCPVYHWWAFGLVPGLCYCTQGCNEHNVCMCLYNYNSLGICTVMGLLGQIKFLFLGPWGSATLSSTMVELVYTPTNSVKVFLFLHILSSICCLQIF